MNKLKLRQFKTYVYIYIYIYIPQKVPMDISEKNETKAMHRITFRASNSVFSVARTTVTFQNDRELT